MRAPTSTSSRQDEVRESLPSLANRVPSAYRWEEEARV